MYELRKEFLQNEFNALRLDDFVPKDEYDFEQTLYEGIPFFIIHFLLKFISPLDGKIIYDLGSGYGRFVISGALNYEHTQFKGIEIVSERIEQSNYFLRKIGIKNAFFIESNVLNFNFSDGDIFFLFNPFSEETLIQVINKLESISKDKSIVVLATGKLNEILLKQNWLECRLNRCFDYKGVDLWNTCVYFSE